MSAQASNNPSDEDGRLNEFTRLLQQGADKKSSISRTKRNYPTIHTNFYTGRIIVWMRLN